MAICVEVVRNQLIAQNIYLKNKKRKISIESHLKSTIHQKEHQRQIYGMDLNEMPV